MLLATLQAMQRAIVGLSARYRAINALFEFAKNISSNDTHNISSDMRELLLDEDKADLTRRV